MKKNYEELKRFLQSEEQVLKEQKYYHVSKMQMDDEQIITSYPNQEVCQERFVIRQKYKNILIPKHRHEYIELSFMLEGELSMQIEGKEIRMRSGDLCLMDTILLGSLVNPAVRTPECTHSGLGSSAFARRYLRNHMLFSLPPAT